MASEPANDELSRRLDEIQRRLDILHQELDRLRNEVRVSARPDSTDAEAPVEPPVAEGDFEEAPATVAEDGAELSEVKSEVVSEETTEAENAGSSLDHRFQKNGGAAPHEADSATEDDAFATGRGQEESGERASAPNDRQSVLDLESRIGAVWLNRVGLVAMVVGFVLLGRYVHPHLMPIHKVLGGYMASALLFGIGLLFEKRLKEFSRPVLAGGLALAFFTSFGSHFVEPMRCVPLWGSLLLMALSVGAIFYIADRWQSEATATLAIFLGHIAAFTAAGDADAFALVAILFLNLTAFVLLVRHDWIPLTFFSVLIAFLSHFLWAVQEHAESTAAVRFWSNTLFLTSYYAVFFTADLIYRWRLAKRGVSAYTPAARACGRCVGPVALVLYAVFTVGIFHVTEVYWAQVHIFLFSLAVVQVIPGRFCHRHASADYVLYAVAGTTFFTLGLFSWLGALTLNLALAAEALLLIVFASRLNLWILNPLAQIVLATNFVHFWVVGIYKPASWPMFLGSVATTFVYFAKARIEEVWQPTADDGIGGQSRWLIGPRLLLGWLMKPLAYLHSLTGVLLLAATTHFFFEPPWSVLATTCFALLVGAASLGLKSPSWLVATWGSQLVVIAFIAELLVRPFLQSVSPPEETAGLVWIVAQISAIGVALFGWSALIGSRWKRSAFVSVAGAGSFLFGAVALFLASFVGQPLSWLFPVWAAGPLFFWLETELSQRWFNGEPQRLSAGFLGVVEKCWTAQLRWFPGLLSIIAATLTVTAVYTTHQGAELAHWLLPLFFLVLILFTIVRKSPYLLMGLLTYLVLDSLLLLAFVSFAPQPRDSVLVWFSVAIKVVAMLALLVSSPFTKRVSFAWASVVCYLVVLVTAAFLVVHENFRLGSYWLWLATLLAMSLATEHLRGMYSKPPEAFAGWHDRFLLETIRSGSDVLSCLLSLGTAAVMVAMSGRHFDSAANLSLVMTTLAVFFFGAALLRRSPAFLLTYLGFHAAAHLYFFSRLGFEIGTRDYPLLTIALVGFSLVAAGLTEKLGRNYWANKERKEGGAAQPFIGLLAIWHPLVLYFLLATLFIHTQTRLHFQDPATVFLFEVLGSVLTFAVGWLFGLIRMQMAAVSWTLLMLVSLALAAILLPDHRSGLLTVGLIAGAAAVLNERLLVWAGNAPLPATLARSSRVLLVLSVAVVALTALTLSDGTRGSWTTLGWSLVALVLMVLGFLWKDPTYRRTALGIFAVAVARLAVVDVARLELFYRMLAFLCLGLCLILVSFLYSRFGKQIRRWL